MSTNCIFNLHTLTPSATEKRKNEKIYRAYKQRKQLLFWIDFPVFSKHDHLILLYLADRHRICCYYSTTKQMGEEGGTDQWWE